MTIEYCAVCECSPCDCYDLFGGNSGTTYQNQWGSCKQQDRTCHTTVHVEIWDGKRPSDCSSHQTRVTGQTDHVRCTDRQTCRHQRSTHTCDGCSITGSVQQNET